MSAAPSELPRKLAAEDRSRLNDRAVSECQARSLCHWALFACCLVPHSNRSIMMLTRFAPAKAVVPLAAPCAPLRRRVAARASKVRLGANIAADLKVCDCSHGQQHLCISALARTNRRLLETCVLRMFHDQSLFSRNFQPARMLHDWARRPPTRA